MRAALAAIIVLLAAFSANAEPIDYFRIPGVDYAPDITTPDEFLGYGLGEKPVRHDVMVDYLRTLAGQSERITAETIGHSLLTQFDGIQIRQVRLPFVDNPVKAQEAREKIEAAAEDSASRPIVINTLVDPELSRIIAQSSALVLDIFDEYISRL
mgnify:CR=1 FL=1